MGVRSQAWPLRRAGRVAAVVACIGLGLVVSAPRARADSLPAYLSDRGAGVATSLFGTYTEHRELLVYAFYEYTRNADEEYKPSELGYGLERDFRGERTENEYLLFLSYGFTPDLAVELESALYTTATLRKAGDDPSSLPAELTESGFGDTQAELRWRWVRETDRRPEVFTYFEAVFPLQRDRVLIGTQEWELVPGIGLVKGSALGTLSARVSASYLPESGTFEFGESALEYLKRFSPAWRGVVAVEGEQDEWALILEAQLRFGSNMMLKLNNGFGLTDKAPDVAPEVGVVFSFR